MTIRRLMAIVFIFGCVSLAWMVLGTSVYARTHSGYDMLGREVQDLWGGPHVQRAPVVTLSSEDKTGEQVELASGQIDVDLDLEHRRKGLLWYATYDVAFDGHYTFINPLDEVMTATVSFQFPTDSAIYDDFDFRVGDIAVTPRGDTGHGLEAELSVEPGEEVPILIAYRSRGLDSWRYSFADQIITVRDFRLTVNTDFEEYDFPEQTISASGKTRTPQGWQLDWEFENLVSDFDVGIDMPHRLNPGPLASRMSYFAPVSLLFFFTVLVVLGAVKGNNLHPMHYFFLGASFFAFHILFSYLVDHLAAGASFVVAALVSLGLVISYLWRVVGRGYAVRQAGVAQLLFLVLFSYAFFFEGYTGLVVTVGAIITLAVLMHVTAGVDWGAVLQGRKPPAAVVRKESA